MTDGEIPKQKRSLLDDLQPHFSQTISLAGNEATHTIHGFEVNIHASGASAIGNVTSGSSKVKITTVTNQNWELPNHHGNLVASNNQYLAYILEGRSGYVLRVIQQDSNNRALLKGFVGAIQDVAFAHTNSNFLACIDQGGNLCVWDLDKATDVSKIQSDGLCVLIQRGTVPDSLEHRLTWCPFVPHEDEEEHDTTVMIAISHGCQVEVFDLKVIFSLLAEGPQISRDKLTEGGLLIESAHDKTVCDLSLSPDGGVLATAAEDGHLKFWEVNWDPEHKPKCLHDFVPHKGAPVSRLIFCDNHLSQDPSMQFWRFLITGANNNTEVKVWCTVSWKCLQTLHFLPPHEASHEVEPHILMTLDHSAQYLLAADSRRMVIYLLQLYQEGSLGDASVTSLTEYLLTQPILSLVFSGHTPFPPPNSESGDDGEVGEEVTVQRDFDGRRKSVLIKLHCIQSRSMQELLVKFEPPDIMGIPPEELKTILSLPGDEHFRKLGQTEVDRKLEEAEVVPTLPPLVDTSTHYTSLPSQFGEGVGYPLSTQPSSLPPIAQPSSLPSDLLTTSSFSTPPASTSFHSLTPSTETSPKLFTPSAFASPAKTEPPSFTHDTTNSAFTPVHSQPQSSTSFTVTPTSITDLKSEASAEESPAELSSSTVKDSREEPPMRKGSPTFKLPTHPLQIQETSKSAEEGLKLKSQEGNEDKLSGADKLNQSGAESDSSSPVTIEGAQQTMDSIFSLLKVDNPHAAPPNTEPEKFNEAGYEEFKRMLVDPPKQWEVHTSAEKSKFETETSEFVAPAAQQHTSLTSGDESTEIVNAAASKTPTEYLDLLRQKVPDEDSLGQTDELQLPLLSKESEWPDIGGPELPKNELQGEGEQDAELQPREDIGEPTELQPSTQHQETVPVLSGNEGNETENLHAAERPLTSAEVTVFPSASQNGEGDSKLGVLVDIAPPTYVGSERDGGGVEVSAGGGVGEERVESEQPGPLPEQERGEDTLGVVALNLEEPPTLVSQIPPDPLTLQPQEGASPRTQKKKKKTRSKKPSTEPLEVVSHSDGEPISELPLVSVAAAPVEAQSVDSTLLSKLYQLVASQQVELQQLREEQQRSFVLLQQQLEEMRVSTVEQHRTSLTEHAREQQQKLDRVLRDKQSLDKQRQDRLISSVSQTLTTAVNTKLDKVVKSEMKNNVLPAVNRSMSIIHSELSSAMDQKLTATDTALKEGINQILRSRGLPEAVGNAVAVSLQRTVQSSYEDVFKAAVLPSFERACQEMFRQIDEAFKRGTTEYIQQYQQLQDPSLQQLTATIHSLHSLLTTQDSPLYTGIQACMQQEFSTMMQHTQQAVSETVASVVQKEVESSIEQHAGKLGSEARLEEERRRKKEEMHKFLQSKDLNMAFELALSTSDLQLVMYLCHQVTPEEVFDKIPCPLSQPVLLSLIQQLSVNLNDQIELKTRYLEQSILALDVSNEVTRSHMSPVLNGLAHHLTGMEKSLQSNPNSSGLARQVRRLRLVAEQLRQPHGR